MNDYYDAKLMSTMEILNDIWRLAKLLWRLAPIGWIIREIVR